MVLSLPRGSTAYYIAASSGVSAASWTKALDIASGSEIRILYIANTSNVLLEISYDGVSAMDAILPQPTIPYAHRTIDFGASGLRLGADVWIKPAVTASSGIFLLTGYVVATL